MLKETRTLSCTRFGVSTFYSILVAAIPREKNSGIMGDNLVNLRAQAIGDVESFINQSILLLQEHLNEEVHTVVHLQDIINHLVAINEDTANPQDWPLNQNSSSDSGGPASSSTARTDA